MFINMYPELYVLRVSTLRKMVKDREAWHATVCGVAKSQTWLSDWITTTKLLMLPNIWNFCI